jgi:hypothetical protein
LAVHPLIGTRTDDPLIRRLPIPHYPYLVFYQVAGDEIVIHDRASRGARSVLDAGLSLTMIYGDARGIDAAHGRL